VFASGQVEGKLRVIIKIFDGRNFRILSGSLPGQHAQGPDFTKTFVVLKVVKLGAQSYGTLL
jgi:hypothetical protein